MFEEPVINICTKDVVTITPDTPLTKAISLMETNNFHNLVVLANDDIYLVYLRDLLFASNPEIPVDDYMFKPYCIYKDSPIIDAVCAMIDSGQRALPVVDDDEKLVGIVTDYDIMKEGSKSRLLKDTEVTKVMTRDPLYIEETDSIGKARSIMRENNIGRLPVFDKKGRLTGIVTDGDILTKVYKPKKRVTIGEIKGEKIPRMAHPVSTIMSSPVITAEIDSNLAEVAGLMQKYDIRGVTIVKDGLLRGIITTKDIMKYLRTLKEEAMIEVEIQGEIDEEYRFLAERIIETEVRKIARFARRVHWIRIVINKERDKGGIPYYKISTYVKTPNKLYVGQGEPGIVKRVVEKSEDSEVKIYKKRWDLIDSLKSSLLSVQKQMERDQEKQTQKERIY